MSADDRVARFWSKVNRQSDACWEWTGATFHNGYGMFHGGRRGGKLDTRYAHRTAYELTHGPVPDGLHVMHSCDNKACCNPAHLSVGTARENVHDAIRKGRFQVTRTR